MRKMLFTGFALLKSPFQKFKIKQLNQFYSKIPNEL